MRELEKIIIFVFNKADLKSGEISCIGIHFEHNISVYKLQDNVVAMPLNDAHLATLFNFRRYGL